MANEVTAQLKAENGQFKAAVRGIVDEMRKLDGQKLGGVQGQIDGMAKDLDKVRGISSDIRLLNLWGYMERGMGSAVEYGKKLFRVFEENEKIAADLEGALRGTGQYSEEALANIDALATRLQGVKAVDDDKVKSAVASLIKGGYSVKEAMQQTKLVMDVAAGAFGGDVEQAADLIVAVFQGRLKGLKAMGIEVGKTNDDMTAMVEEAIGKLAAIYDGAWEKLQARSPAKAITTLLGDIQDNLAKGLVPALTKDLADLSAQIADAQALAAYSGKETGDAGTAAEQYGAASGMMLRGAGKAAAAGGMALLAGAVKAVEGAVNGPSNPWEQKALGDAMARGETPEPTIADRIAQQLADEATELWNGGGGGSATPYARQRLLDAAAAKEGAAQGPVTAASPAVAEAEAARREEEAKKARDAAEKRAAAAEAAAQKYMGAPQVTVRVLTGQRSHAYSNGV